MKLKPTQTLMKLLLLSLITVFSFCKKDSNNNVKTDPVYTQYGTPFAGVPSTSDAVIYQVNLRAFSANHDFKSVTTKLDAIKSLGVNVVYLMPIYPVGVKNSAG